MNAKWLWFFPYHFGWLGHSLKRYAISIFFVVHFDGFLFFLLRPKLFRVVETKTLFLCNKQIKYQRQIIPTWIIIFLQNIYISVFYLYPFNSWWFARKNAFYLHCARVSPFDYRQIKSLTNRYWCYILWFYSMVLFHGSSPLSLPLFCSISILIPFDYMNEKCFHTHTYIICCFSNSILNFIFLNSMMLSSSFHHRIDCARATLSIQNNRKMLIWNERT